MAAEQQTSQTAAHPSQTTHEEILAIFARRQEAYEDLDAAALAAEYADHVQIESPITGPHGKAEAERNLQLVFDAFMDLKVTFDPPIIDGSHAAQLVTTEGTNMGGLLGLPPSGRAFKMNMALFFDFEAGKIVRERRIYDFTGLLVQVGILKAKPC